MLEWTAAVDELQEVVGIAAIVLVCLAAFAFGSVRTRLVAGLMLLNSVAIATFEVYLTGVGMLAATAVKASVLLLAYAWICWRWTHMWLIVLTSLQCMDVLLVMARVADPSILLSVNALTRNFIGWLMLLTLAVATVQAKRLQLMKRARS